MIFRPNMPKTKKGLLIKLTIWEKQVEKAPKLNQYLIFCLSFVLSLSVGLVIAYSFRKLSEAEVNKQKQEIWQLEQQRMIERIEKFRKSF